MVTQKGIQGITPYEKITYSHKNNWANVLDEKLCVPFQSKFGKFSTIIKMAYYSGIIFCFFFLIAVTGNPIVSDDLSNQQLSFCNNTFHDYTMYCNESKPFIIKIILISNYI